MTGKPNIRMGTDPNLPPVASRLRSASARFIVVRHSQVTRTIVPTSLSLWFHNLNMVHSSPPSPNPQAFLLSHHEIHVPTIFCCAVDGALQLDHLTRGQTGVERAIAQFMKSDLGFWNIDKSGRKWDMQFQRMKNWYERDAKVRKIVHATSLVVVLLLSPREWSPCVEGGYRRINHCDHWVAYTSTEAISGRMNPNITWSVRALVRTHSRCCPINLEASRPFLLPYLLQMR